VGALRPEPSEATRLRMVAWLRYRGGKPRKGGLMTTEDPPNRGDVPRLAAGLTTRSHVFQVLVLGSWVLRTGRKKIGQMDAAKPNQKDRVLRKELLEEGLVIPVIDGDLLP